MSPCCTRIGAPPPIADELVEGAVLRPVRGSAAHGFTMIELLVAMIILAVVSAGVSRVLLNGWSGTGKSATDQQAATAVLEATDRIRHDLLLTQSIGRDPNDVRSAGQLSTGLLSTTPPGGVVKSLDPTLTGTDALKDVRDVAEATATSITIRVPGSDATTGAAVQYCVKYQATTQGDGWVLNRSSWTDGWRGTAAAGLPCSGGPGSTEAIYRSAGSLPDGTATDPRTGTLIPALFSFRYVCNLALCPGGAGGCNERTVQPASIVSDARYLNLITGVNIGLMTITSRGQDSAARSNTNTKLSIRSRESGLYREALGCG